MAVNHFEFLFIKPKNLNNFLDTISESAVVLTIIGFYLRFFFQKTGGQKFVVFLRYLEDMKASQFAFEFSNLYFRNIDILYLVTIDVIKLNYLYEIC